MSKRDTDKTTYKFGSSPSEAVLEQDLVTFRRAAKEYNTMALSTSASAAVALSSSGIYTPSGNLTSKYK